SASEAVVQYQPDGRLSTFPKNTATSTGKLLIQCLPVSRDTRISIDSHHLPPRIGITTPSLSLCCTQISVMPNGAVTFHPGSSDTQVPSCPNCAILTASNRMNCSSPFRSNQSVPAPYCPIG